MNAIQHWAALGWPTGDVAKARLTTLFAVGTLLSHLMLVPNILAQSSESPQRTREGSRGGVAVNSGQHIFLSWRLLPSDPTDCPFDVYQKLPDNPSYRRLNSQPLAAGTWFIDDQSPIDQSSEYWIVPSGQPPVENDPPTIHYDPTDGNYLSIPTDLPKGYHANDASIGDLDGDGRMELVVHLAGDGRDSSQAGLTDPPMLDAYRLDGQHLWRIQLGHNCREGAHYNPFLVFDLDQDGKAEVVCRTADGTVDGQDNVLGDPDADWRMLAGSPRNSLEGKVLQGPEYLTVFEGETGRVIDSIPFAPGRSVDDHSPDLLKQKQIWGDDYGNRMDRFLATIAWLSPDRPSLVMTRGYYTRSVLCSFRFTDQRLVPQWTFDSDQNGPANISNPWRGQGNHSIHALDIDQDGKDEILFGAMAIDDDGQGIYSTRLGHGDAQHTGDLDPGRPGLETWSIHENERPTADFIGSEMRDTKTGEVLWIGVQGRDVARGMAADIDPRYPGSEVWGGSRTLYASNGTPIGPAPRCTNMAIWWDGDLQRELLSGVRIIKWDFASTRETVLLEGRSLGLRSNNGSKDNPCLVVDLLGDWREELIARTRDNREIRIYVSTIPTAYRQLPLLMDRAYRNSIAWQNVGYNQPAHPSFDLQSTLDQAPVFLSNVVIGKLMQDAKQPPEALTESELKSAILKESELGNFTLPGTFQSASILPLRTHFYDTLPGKEMIFQCKTVFLKPDGSTVERWVLVKKKFPDDMQRDSELPN